MKSAILVFPGINRERDMARALKLASGHEPAMVWHAESSLPAGTDLVVVPGGFSYGDYLRCGAIAARAPVMDAVRAFAGQGGLVLGVCNGFQILCEAGLLPGVLMRNARLKFVCRDVHLRVERSDTPFTRGYNAGQVIRVPTAHGEGNYEADEETLKRLEGEGRVLYRYCAADGSLDERSNINGAAHSIAGIVSDRGNVLGMMPHPENHVEAIMGCTDGRGLFAGLAEHLDRAAFGRVLPGGVAVSGGQRAPLDPFDGPGKCEKRPLAGFQEATEENHRASGPHDFS
jgi:phosphoribosylformylglycinamidine synthase subunit PurQ / glutaminase